MIPPKFLTIIKDFTTDLFVTFPELKTNTDLLCIHENEITNESALQSYQCVFDTVVASFPQCTMDILQENESLFTVSRVFLPNIDFKDLWNDTITEKTKSIIWKYLKLILFSIIEHMNKDGTGPSFQDADVQERVKLAMEEIKNLFDGKDVPNTDDMHSHLEGMMHGKLGLLAKEIAEETIGDVKEVDSFQDLMKDPSKLFGLVSTVGDKIDKKIKAGELKESELIEEATEMFSKMKDMPGMKQFEALFKGKMNMGAMQTKMDQNLKRAKMKERLQKKLATRDLPVTPETVVVEPAPKKKKKKNKNKENKDVVLDS